MLNEIILDAFKSKMGKEISKLDLIITLDFDDWGNYMNECEIFENTTNGRTWNVITTKSGKIKNIFEVK